MQQITSARPQAAARSLRRSGAPAGARRPSAPLLPRRGRLGPRLAAAAAEGAESLQQEEDIDLEDQVEIFMKRQAELESGGEAPRMPWPRRVAVQTARQAGAPRTALLPPHTTPRAWRPLRTPMQPHLRAPATRGRSSAATSCLRRCGAAATAAARSLGRLPTPVPWPGPLLGRCSASAPPSRTALLR
jgi:hypothetical protein